MRILNRHPDITRANIHTAVVCGDLEERQAKRVEGTFTPLMWLPDDDRLAVAVAELLLLHGADPSLKSNEGKTAGDYAEETGLYAAADLLKTRS